jgi:hypothetical protein
MGNQFVEVTEKAIDKLVDVFQKNPERYWNERDIHWILYYYIKKEEVIKEKYLTELIRAEFPTRQKFGVKIKARGHYDLVILDPVSFRSDAVQKFKAQDPWDDFLELVNVEIAVEIKLWLSRLPCKRADWDIEKLTDTKDQVVHPYFLNFVQLNFNKTEMRNFYRDLREYLTPRAQSPLKILCVPSDKTIQPDSKNWL